MPSEKPTTTIAIFGGGQVVGQALKLLLQGVDREVRLLENLTPGGGGESVVGAHLVILAPRIPAEGRDTFLTDLRSDPATAGIPVLELVAPCKGAEDLQECQVPWPCRTEELQRRIEAALLESLSRDR